MHLCWMLRSPFLFLALFPKGVHYEQEYFSKLLHDCEFKKYVNSLGYEVKITIVHGSKLTKYEYQPASTYNGTYTSRAKTEIHVNLLYLI